jgi:hypothetical protein
VRALRRTPFLEDVLDSLTESVRRNIRTKPLRRALTLASGVLWAIFAGPTLSTLLRIVFGAG